MGDLVVRQSDDGVEPTNSVRLKWYDVQIQEKKSQMAANKQTQEDIVKGQLVRLEADYEMLELKLAKLKNEREELLTGVEIIIN